MIGDQDQQRLDEDFASTSLFLQSMEGLYELKRIHKPSTRSYEIYGVSRVRSRGNIVVNG